MSVYSAVTLSMYRLLDSRPPPEPLRQSSPVECAERRVGPSAVRHSRHRQCGGAGVYLYLHAYNFFYLNIVRQRTRTLLSYHRHNGIESSHTPRTHRPFGFAGSNAPFGTAAPWKMPRPVAQATALP